MAEGESEGEDAEEPGESKPSETDDAENPDKDTIESQGEGETPQKDIHSEGDKPSDELNTAKDSEEVIEAPDFWNAEQKAAFAKAPPEIKKIIRDSEVQRTGFLNRVANEAQAARTEQRALDKVYEPYGKKFKSWGLDRVKATERLMQWQELLDEDPEFAITELAKRYGVSPANVLRDREDEDPVPTRDPRLDSALSELEELRDWRESVIASQQESARTQLQNEIDSFRTEVGQDGKPLRPHFDVFAPQIGQEVQKLRAEYPNGSVREILNKAYDRIVGHIRSTYVEPEAKRISEERAKQTLNRSQRAQAVSDGNVRTAPPSRDMLPKPTSIREAVEMAFELASNRA